jgi:alpha-D-ribose 1-methylphosphonate 5-triphosphate synthase subunit PhnH
MTRENMARETLGGLCPGFDDPGLRSQGIFRLALRALSRPALPVPLGDMEGLPFWPKVPPILSAMALTLLDGQTPVWLSSDLLEAMGSLLAFHCQCPIEGRADRAAFVLASSLRALPPVSSLRKGELRSPEESATVLLLTEPGPGAGPFLASGPGIEGSLVMEGHGLPLSFLELWRENRAAYPLGADFFLLGPMGLTGLPRGISLDGIGR